MRLFFVLITTSLFFSLESRAEIVRWTGSEDANAEFLHVVQVLNQKTGFHLTSSDFFIVEDRPLANNQFKMYVQTVDGIPLSARSIRVWTDLQSGALIQAEALVESDRQLNGLSRIVTVQWPAFTQENPAITKKEMRDQAVAAVKKNLDDPFVREVTATEEWEGGQRIYIVNIKAKHGVHQIKFQSDFKNQVSQTYTAFPDGDGTQKFSKEDEADEFSLPALVYPIYEEAGSNLIQNRVVTQLRHLKKSVKGAGDNPYQILRDRHYYSDKQDAILGLTPEGQADGYWSMTDIKARVRAIYNGLTSTENSFANGGVILQGRYATINIHPDAVKNFNGIAFTPKMSSIFKPAWHAVSGDLSGVEEMIPGGSFLGKPLAFYEEAYQRPARRLPDHNPVAYLNDGFDEVQVYFAINTLMQSLQQIGFTDPDFSTRPFHAFLYDPDIGSRDNAYYTDDTINFATYSPEAQNYARDNSTIWHELGHGIMDRLMGDSVQLADTGGLSEGMADFVAALVIEKVTKGQPFDGSNDFRIVNSTGFSLTNEVHDDGEAYGGAMRDLLVLARTKYGVEGVTKVGDLTMETMRLCRNHPGITAIVWFSHMLFADQLGHGAVRAPGELSELIHTALANRNFTFDGQKPAEFKLIYNDKELNDHDAGSRHSPIRVTLAPDQKATYALQVVVNDGDAYKFQFPVRVRVQLKHGPLQGAIHWDGEENVFVDYTLNNPGELLALNLTISAQCDFKNRDDGSCVDFAYVQIWPLGATAPVAKKRFYLRLMPSAPGA